LPPRSNCGSGRHRSGGVESLIEHRASIEGAGSPCPGDLLRFSCGLEACDELYLDLARALALAA